MFKMNYKRIYFMDDRPDVYLDCFVSSTRLKNRDALLIIPGGGYCVVCTSHEGYPIAEAFQPYGFNCFVLHYHVGDDMKYPEPQLEASYAMKYIRENSDALEINPERVFIMGFSAGGHLAGCLAAKWQEYAVEPYGINKPTGAVLCYPVLTAEEGHRHTESFCNLLKKDNIDDVDLAPYSIDKCVSEHSAPAFFMHTSDDPVVPVESSLFTALAYKENGIPFEMHIFNHGPHGVSLANEVTCTPDSDCAFFDSDIAKWVEYAAKWMRRIK